MSFIIFPIWPAKLAITINLICFPSTYIYSLIISDKSPLTILHIIVPFTFEKWAIVPKLLTLSKFLTSSPITYILEAFISIEFLTLPMLFAINPFSAILWSIFPYLSTFAMLNSNAINHFYFSIEFNIIR